MSETNATISLVQTILSVAFCAFLASAQGCAKYVPVFSDGQQSSLGKIAIISFDKEPVVSLIDLPATKGEAAFGGAVQALGESVFSCGLLFPVCAVVAVPIYSIGNAASTESPDSVSIEEGIQNASEMIRNGSAMLKTKLTEFAVDYKNYNLSDDLIDSKLLTGDTIYQNLRKRGYGSVLEVSIDEIESRSPEEKNIVYFLIRGSASLKNTTTGEVILTRDFITGTSGNRPVDWITNGSRNLMHELNMAYEILAQQIIEKIFLTEYILEGQKFQTQIFGVIRGNALQFEPETFYPGTSQCVTDFSHRSYIGFWHCTEFKNQIVVEKLQPFLIWKDYPVSFAYQQRFDINLLRGQYLDRKSRSNMKRSDLAAFDKRLMGVKQVLYDLRLFSWPDGIVYEKSGLTETEHQIKQFLESCRSYSWSVRARYINNLKIKASGWSHPRLFRTPCGVAETGRDELTIPENSSVKDSVTMVYIKGDHFMMGKAIAAADNSYLRQHKVYVNDFFLDEQEVTQRQFVRVMHFNPSKQLHPDNPVEQVRWDQARQYCERVGKRLPTEAEWEFAARTGTESRFSFNELDAGDYGNYCYECSPLYDQSFGASKRKISHVKSLKPNSWGLYDMHGNVAEWVDDWYGTYPTESLVVSKKPTELNPKVIRGGSFSSTSEEAASYARDKENPIDISEKIGFRCAAD